MSSRRYGGIPYTTNRIWQEREGPHLSLRASNLILTRSSQFVRALSSFLKPGTTSASGTLQGVRDLVISLAYKGSPIKSTLTVSVSVLTKVRVKRFPSTLTKRGFTGTRHSSFYGSRFTSIVETLMPGFTLTLRPPFLARVKVSKTFAIINPPKQP